MLVGFLGELGDPRGRGPRELARRRRDARALPRRARRSTSTPKKDALSRRLAAPPRDQPAPHPRLEGPARSGAPSQDAPDAPRLPRRRRPRALREPARHLDALGTPYTVDPRLVRGLDYYTRTLFEIKGAHEKLGAGSTLLGGGRYDGMIDELGGPQVPAIGFAAGLERLLIASEPTAAPSTVDAIVAPLGDAAIGAALVLARDLRRARRLGARSTRAAARSRASSGARTRSARGSCSSSAIASSPKNVVQVKDLEAHAQDTRRRATRSSRTSSPRASRPRAAERPRADGAGVDVSRSRFATRRCRVDDCGDAAHRRQRARARSSGRGKRRLAAAAHEQPKPSSDDDEDHAPLLRTRAGDRAAVRPARHLARGRRRRSARDWDGRPPSPEGAATTSWFPYYERSARRLPPPPAAAASHRAARAACAIRRRRSTASRRRRTPRASTACSTTGAAR